MSSLELLHAAYDWLHGQAALMALAFAALPVLGTVAARVGKGGRTDADGKLIASLVIGIALTLVFVEAGALLLASKVLRRDILTVAMLGDAVLVIGPPLSLIACIMGMRTVFPLGQLTTIRTLRDVALLVGFGYALIWAFGQFRGWGVWFLGGVTELLMLGAVAVAVLVYLYRRAFKQSRP